MTPTIDFTETFRDRVRREPAVADALLEQCLECLHTGEVNVARVLLCDYIHALMGFEQLGRLTGKPPESLEHMLETDDNPEAGNLLEIANLLRQHRKSQTTADSLTHKPISIT